MRWQRRKGEFTVEVLFVLFGGDMWFGKSGFGGFLILVTAVAWGVVAFGWWFDEWLDWRWAAGFFYLFLFFYIFGFSVWLEICWKLVGKKFALIPS